MNCAACISRKGFSELKAYLRKGDTLCVYPIDRLGRDAVDIRQSLEICYRLASMFMWLV